MKKLVLLFFVSCILFLVPSAQAADTSWQKVKDLSVGQYIKTVDGFEKIKSIELLPPEQVWDISISGNHNFVGNGIVAHNTTLQWPDKIDVGKANEEMDKLTRAADSLSVTGGPVFAVHGTRSLEDFNTILTEGKLVHRLYTGGNYDLLSQTSRAFLDIHDGVFVIRTTEETYRKTFLIKDLGTMFGENTLEIPLSKIDYILLPDEFAIPARGRFPQWVTKIKSYEEFQQILNNERVSLGSNVGNGFSRVDFALGLTGATGVVVVGQQIKNYCFDKSNSESLLCKTYKSGLDITGKTYNQIVLGTINDLVKDGIINESKPLAPNFVQEYAILTKLAFDAATDSTGDGKTIFDSWLIFRGMTSAAQVGGQPLTGKLGSHFLFGRGSPVDVSDDFYNFLINTHGFKGYKIDKIDKDDFLYKSLIRDQVQRYINWLAMDYSMAEKLRGEVNKEEFLKSDWLKFPIKIVENNNANNKKQLSIVLQMIPENIGPIETIRKLGAVERSDLDNSLGHFGGKITASDYTITEKADLVEITFQNGSNFSLWDTYDWNKDRIIPLLEKYGDRSVPMVWLSYESIIKRLVPNEPTASFLVNALSGLIGEKSVTTPTSIGDRTSLVDLQERGYANQFEVTGELKINKKFSVTVPKKLWDIIYTN